MPEPSKSRLSSEPRPLARSGSGSGHPIGPYAWFRNFGLALAISALTCASVVSCSGTRETGERTIEFTRIPPADTGSPDKLEQIEGRVRGARAGERVVLFALSGKWWVQPLL